MTAAALAIFFAPSGCVEGVGSRAPDCPARLLVGNRRATKVRDSWGQLPPPPRDSCGQFGDGSESNCPHEMPFDLNALLGLGDSRDSYYRLHA